MHIQEILGHKILIATQIYIHVSNGIVQNVVLPFDDL